MTAFRKIVEGRKDYYSEYVENHSAILCKDGFKFSVQASSFHYCSPRNNIGPYSHVEVGYPSQTPIPEIMEYAEDASKPTQTVYGYVPVELVQKLIDAHGGEDNTIKVNISPLELEFDLPEHLT
jgi:hypothetical protein